MDSVFWAAFGGGAAAGIFALLAVAVAELSRWFVDRPLLKVEASLGFIVGGVPKDEARKVFLTARNPHTKSVTINSFGLSFKKKKHGALWITAQGGFTFPYVLEGGRSLQQWKDVAELIRTLRKCGRSPSDLKRAWFVAASGKTYSSGIDKHTIRKLQAEFEADPGHD